MDGIDLLDVLIVRTSHFVKIQNEMNHFSPLLLQAYRCPLPRGICTELLMNIFSPVLIQFLFLFPYKNDSVRFFSLAELVVAYLDSTNS